MTGKELSQLAAKVEDLREGVPVVDNKPRGAARETFGAGYHAALDAVLALLEREKGR